MSFEFLPSKAGELTCTFNGVFLHSKYNPVAEGEKFADSIQADFSPLCIIVLEPCLSFCAKKIRQNFPNAKICAIRFSREFSKTDGLWDLVFYGAEENFSHLSDDLFNALGEEALISSVALDWNPSKNLFPELNFSVWNEIKKAAFKARDVMGTRAYFSKRWLKNSILFCSRIENGVILKNNLGNQSVIIAASGPSLKNLLPKIKKNNSRLFIIALSSALKVLLKNDIEPDMIISSDGGFWAKRHLSFPGKNKTNLLFGIESEGACFSELFENNKILPLSYEDSLSLHFLNAIECPFVFTRRNGTVAGTALELALSLTNGKVYLAGFDQAPAIADQHTQPNVLEEINMAKDNKLSPKETRVTKSRFGSSSSLEVYRNWFVSNSERFSSRVERVSENYKFDYKLGKIKDISWKEVILNDKTSTEKIYKEFNIELSKSQRKTILLEELKKISTTEDFCKEVFPMNTLLIKREKSEEKKSQLKNELNLKIENFISEIEKII